jgi:hypothetical protein
MLVDNESVGLKDKVSWNKVPKVSGWIYPLDFWDKNMELITYV